MLSALLAWKFSSALGRLSLSSELRRLSPSSSETSAASPTTKTCTGQVQQTFLNKSKLCKYYARRENTIFVKPRVSSSLYSSSPAAKKGILSNHELHCIFSALLFPVLFALFNIHFIMIIKHNLDRSFHYQYQCQHKQ